MATLVHHGYSNPGRSFPIRGLRPNPQAQLPGTITGSQRTAIPDDAGTKRVLRLLHGPYPNPSSQRPTKMICAYPPCKKTFTPKSKTQTCCCKAHAQNVRSYRFYQRHPRPTRGRPKKTQSQKDKTLVQRITRNVLSHGTDPTQIQIWVDEICINAVDYTREETL